MLRVDVLTSWCERSLFMSTSQILLYDRSAGVTSSVLTMSSQLGRSDFIKAIFLYVGVTCSPTDLSQLIRLLSEAMCDDILAPLAMTKPKNSFTRKYLFWFAFDIYSDLRVSMMLKWH